MTVAAALALAMPVSRAFADPPPGPRRFALLIASTDGGRERARLRYPSKDTDAFARVLKELGGVRSEDIDTLVDPDSAAVEKKLIELKGRLQGITAEKQLFFYYSGHSDERGLLLFQSRLEYARLRSLITAIPVDVHIGILDSCAAGAFAQRKGGVASEPFLMAQASGVTGHAFLTSTSEREAAQESGRLRGSFFTHALVSALRGAADLDGDQRVTLQEAYRFAFDETLARTEATLGGPQHAAYDIQLVGRGDLILTDLRDASARLFIAQSVTGRVIVRNVRGALAAEINKPSSAAPLALSLEPGTYRVTVFDAQRVRRASITLSGVGARLVDEDLHAVPLEMTAMRGGGTDAIDFDVSDEDRIGRDDPDYRRIPFNAGIVPPWSVNAIEKQRGVLNYFSLNLGWGRSTRLYGAELGVLGAYVTEELRGLQGALAFAYTGGRMFGAQASFGANILRGIGFGAQLGTVNLAFSDLNGLQAAMVSYTAGDLRGAQLAAFNLTSGTLTGLQAGSVSYATRLRGLQVGGINIGSQITGTQLGALNIASGRVRGVQLGLINIADDADVQIGLFSVSKKGSAHLDVFFSDSAAINLSLRLRARYSYSLLSFGVHPAGEGAGWMYGLGFGFHAPLHKILYGEIDATVYGVQKGFAALEVPSLLTVTRLVLGLRFHKRFAAFFGPTFNMQWGFKPDEDPQRPGFNLGSEATPIPRWRIWPGLSFGIEI